MTGRIEDFMEVSEALQIVVDLARQNVIDIRDMPAEHARQMEAIDTVEDYRESIHKL